MRERRPVAQIETEDRTSSGTPADRVEHVEGRQRFETDDHFLDTLVERLMRSIDGGNAGIEPDASRRGEAAHQRRLRWAALDRIEIGNVDPLEIETLTILTGESQCIPGWYRFAGHLCDRCIPIAVSALRVNRAPLAEIDDAEDFERQGVNPRR